MTTMMLIGDIHGKWQAYSEILKTANVDRTVQVGDFGWGFHGQDTGVMPGRVLALETAMDTYNGGDNRYIRGNHDNPAMCKQHRFCIDDLTYEPDTGIMFMGGAWSIDRAWRTEGIDWWADEELSYNDLQTAIDVYESVKPRIMVTHECPEDVVGKMFPWYRKEFSSRTRDALGTMFYLHKPELWVFGHWHTNADRVVDNTRFVCLNELNTMLVDV